MSTGICIALDSGQTIMIASEECDVHQG